MKNIIFKFFWVFLFVGACIGTTYYLYQKKQKPSQLFKTENPVFMDIIKKTIATGTIEPRKEVLVKPQVSGIIDKIYFKAGENVRKGDVIAKIKIIPEMTRLNDAESVLNTAKINVDLAQKEYDRQKKLLDDKVITQFDYIRFEQDYLIKKEQFENAQNNLDLVKKGSSKRIMLTTTDIRATIDGKILDIPVKEGTNVIQANTFNEGTTIASLANMDDLIFKGKIVESEVGKLQLGMPLNLTIGALSTDTFPAKLEFIASKGLEEKGSIQFEVKAGLISNVKNIKIRAGYSANADIILDKRKNVLTIKERNIEFKNDSAFIYLESEKQLFTKKQIKIGLSDDLNVEIIEGLDPKAKVKIL